MQLIKICVAHSSAFFQESIKPTLTQLQMKVLAVALCALALLAAAIWWAVKGGWPFGEIKKVLPQMGPEPAPVIVDSPSQTATKLDKPLDDQPVEVKEPKPIDPYELRDEYFSYLWNHSDQIQKACVDLGFAEPDVTNATRCSYDVYQIALAFTIPKQGQYRSPYIDIRTHTKAELLEKLLSNINNTLSPYLNFVSMIGEWQKENRFKEYVASREVWHTLSVALAKRGVELESVELSHESDFSHGDGKVSVVCSTKVRVSYGNAFCPQSRKDRISDYTRIGINCYLNDVLETEETIWKRWQERVDALLEDFLLDVSGLKPKEPGLFSPFSEHPEPPPAIDVESQLILIQSMMGLEKDLLVRLAKEGKNAELKDKLKQIKKQGALRFHPDKAAAAGLKPEDLNEDFKKFYAALAAANASIDQRHDAPQPQPTIDIESLLDLIEGMGGLEKGLLHELAKEKKYKDLEKELRRINHKYWDKLADVAGLEFDKTWQELEEFEALATIVKAWVNLQKSLS